MREFDAECITSGDDVRELIGLGPSPMLDFPADDRPPTDDATRVRDALSLRTWRDAQEIARRSGLSRDEVEVHLGFLLLDASVERGPAGWRLRPPR